MRIFHLIFKRVGPINITDVDFADDIALLSEELRTATELFHRLESAAANIGLFINVGKTKVTTLNLGDQVGDLQRSHRKCKGLHLSWLLDK